MGFGGGGAPNGGVAFFAGDASSSKKSSSSPLASSPKGDGAVAVAAADTLSSPIAASAPTRDTASVSTLGVSPPNKSPRPPVLRSTHPASLVSSLAGAAFANAGGARAGSSGAGPNAEAECTRWKPCAGRSSEAAEAVADAAVADADGRASDVPPGCDPDEDQIGVVASPSSSWSLTSGHSSSLSSSPAFARPRLDAPGPVSGAAMAPATHALAASRGVVRNSSVSTCRLSGSAKRVRRPKIFVSGHCREGGPPLPSARLCHAAAVAVAVARPSSRLPRRRALPGYARASARAARGRSTRRARA